MRVYLNSNRAAFVLLAMISILALGFGVLLFAHYRTFSFLLWVASIPLFNMTVLSYTSIYRFPVLFNGVSVFFGCIYSLIITTGVFALLYTAMLRGFGLSDQHPIRMSILNYAAVFMMLLFFVMLVIDAVKFRPDLRAGLSRLLIGVITFPPFCCLLLGLGSLID